MKSRRGIIFYIYDGFELLDLSGPASVFSMADSLGGGGAYFVETVSAQGGMVRSGSGLSVSSLSLRERPVRNIDTVLAVGAMPQGLMAAMACEASRVWMQRACGIAERFGSICSGAFILAEAGLLDGHRVATHWEGCRQLAKAYPRIDVDPDALYVQQGKLWTSAGVTTGIDMALAMVEKDHGPVLKAAVAKALVVYAHRPGNQSQFSAVLEAQTAATGFSDLGAWIEERLDRPIRVEEMARQAGMSERTFYRRFTQRTGMTPSKYLETLRLDRARQMLEAGRPVKTVAHAVGFASEGGFRAAFEARYDLAPSLHRVVHGSA
ncbi:GlxA family transcriptional regulator [Parasphingopyxis marina]|uniref:Helix-turn-helix domain-containing protein n=1 Tax=Parasphingopyxis marina TaxID=2761622 RepID=A0A842HY58_9SPHN|nr:helix-turn-helix domain-containing protein [Parasphingopyxis marina]MBC2777281.1 helix-turn-helix domain-containing protein [Parasphingopyxis marina]